MSSFSTVEVYSINYVNTPQFGTITMTMSPARELQVSARLLF
jgi:hypothetical protein